MCSIDSPSSGGASAASPVIKPVHHASDVLPAYAGTAIEKLLRAHCLGEPVETEVPELVIVSCMDFRIDLRLGGLKAYQARTAGATPVPVVGNVAFARVAFDITALAVIGHTDCAMCRVETLFDDLGSTLRNRETWSDDEVDDMIDVLQRDFAISDPVSGTLQHVAWLRERFPACIVAPLLYDVADHSMAQIVETDQGDG